MEQSEGLSCPLCLQADEPAGMLHVQIDHGAVVREQTVTLCRACVEAIGRAVRELGSASGELELADGAAADEQPPAEVEPAPAEGEQP